MDRRAQRGLARSSVTEAGIFELTDVMRRPEKTTSALRLPAVATTAKRVRSSHATAATRQAPGPSALSSARASCSRLRTTSARPVRGNWTIDPRLM